MINPPTQQIKLFFIIYTGAGFIVSKNRVMDFMFLIATAMFFYKP